MAPVVFCLGHRKLPSTLWRIRPSSPGHFPPLLLSPFRLHLEGHFLQEASPSTPNPLPTSLPPHAPPTPTLSLNLSMLPFTTFSITCNYFIYLFSFLVCLPRKQSSRNAGSSPAFFTTIHTPSQAWDLASGGDTINIC